MQAKRGVVISNPVRIMPDGGLSMSTALDPQELRFALLFWDELDFPSNNIVRIPDSPEVEFLCRAGVMDRSDVTVPPHVNGGDPIAYASIQAAVFVANEHREPGAWSVAVGERSVSFPNEDFDTQRGRLVELFRGLPVPNRDVPLQDILEFKERRRDELVALRTHLEGIYAKVDAAADGELAWRSEVDSFQAAVNDEVRCAKEFGMTLRWASFEAGLNLPAGAVAAATAVTAGLPIVSALAVGGAATISLKGGPSLRWRTHGPSPFRYVSRYHDEVF